MEGIRDGAAVDSCFLCSLFYPERYTNDCPRCHRRMHYVPAEHLDPATFESSLDGAIDAFRAATDDRSALEGLLALVHDLQPQSVAHLDRRGIEIDTLRRAWERLS